MRYLLLIYSDEKERPSGDQGVMAAYDAFTAEVQARNVYESGDALHPVSTATTVRLRDGQVLTTDGPFAETKEQLGGFYLLNCRDLDEALEFAAKIPGAKYGSIEVRPIVDFSQTA